MTGWFIWWSAFSGAAFGLPTGFLAIEVIKWLASRKQIVSPRDQAMEWAIAQSRAEIIKETQIADRWVRTYDFENLQSDDCMLEEDMPAIKTIELPFRFATDVTGGRAIVALRCTDSEQEAMGHHASAVNKVRKDLQIIP